MSSSLIVVEHGTLSFSNQRILAGVNLRIGGGERIGLVGPNGSGKSTLLRVMLGQQALDDGRVVRARDCRIGYLPQDVLQLPQGALLASVISSVPGRADLEHRMANVERELGASTDPEEQMELAHLLAELHDSLDHFETYYGEQYAVRILKGLGFGEDDLSRDVSELSGGWKMRAALAGLLFQQPDVLFLDEPTNHLDVPSVLWLDAFLEQYKHALVLICHDRSFLNRHIARVVSFEPEGLRSYRGNYDDYLSQRSGEEEILSAQARNRDRQIKEMERFVERFRAKATKARQAQSRAKQIEKLQREIDRPVAQPRRLSFRFPPVQRSGRDVVTIDHLSKSYGPRVLYHQLEQRVFAGDRVAIIGANGVGKTTLLKLIAQEIAADSGQIVYGANVELGYYAQHHTELLDDRRTVLEQVWQMKPDASESFVRGICGAFLFSGDEVEKAIGVLSGGERARVLLARLLTRPGNLLLMDEPTNHLDIAAAEALAEALCSYDGTLVFVSHNTSFINRLATKVWDIQNQRIEEYPGNLAEYVEHLARREQSRTSDSQTADPALGSATSSTATHPAPANQTSQAGGREGRQQRKERKRKEAAQRSRQSKRLRKVRDEVAQLESRIGKLEEELKLAETELATPEITQQQERYQQTLNSYMSARDKLDELYGRWEARQAELEELGMASDPEG
jgi:ATP-binding cassette subfamily F protein 3